VVVEASLRVDPLVRPRYRVRVGTIVCWCRSDAHLVCRLRSGVPVAPGRRSLRATPTCRARVAAGSRCYRSASCVPTSSRGPPF